MIDDHGQAAGSRDLLDIGDEPVDGAADEVRRKDEKGVGSSRFGAARELEGLADGPASAGDDRDAPVHNLDGGSDNGGDLVAGQGVEFPGSARGENATGGVLES